MTTQSGQVWVWSPVNDKGAGFRHPADLPADEEALAKTCFVENVRGPKMPAKLSQAQMLDKKGRTVLIAENGTTREVPSSLVLSWYEGLLLLQELQEKQDKPNWWETEMVVLEKERSKFKDGQLAASLYLERRLLNTAVTGKSFVDGAGQSWEYRRDRLEQASADDGEIPDGSGFWRIRDIVGYLPPWEAFCHEKCGFYQDFYQVQWAHPYSEIDYSMVENGCTDTKGATWEPDECLPACMDTLRISAKKEWIKKRREQESAMAERARAKKRADDEAAAAQKRAQGQPPLKRLRSEDEESKKAPASRKTTKRDGNPLVHDVFLSECGHDFAPPSADKIGEIRSGWPKSAEEYPKGYGVANPPGFCTEGCDCMDDQRPQRSWETTKAWLEDANRTASVRKAVDEFGQQSRFVRRRGQVSNLCYFEALSSNVPDLPHANAAVKLAEGVSGSITTALKRIPLHSLKAESHAVRIPARAFVKESADYAPLRCTGTLQGGGAFPGWLRLHPDDARLYTEGAPEAGVAEMSLSLEFRYAEGNVVPATIGITPQKLGGPDAPWVAATARIVTKFQDERACPLHPSARGMIKEHLGDVFDFQRGAPKDKTLGEWLSVMSKLLRMLRSTAVANINITPVHRAPAAR